MDKKIKNAEYTKKILYEFFTTKGINNLDHIKSNEMILTYISSVNFMELIMYIEDKTKIALDISSANLSEIMSIGGFINWINTSQKNFNNKNIT